MMEKRTLGYSGLRTSLIGLGCNNFGMWMDREPSLDVIRKALDVGITTFDTADSYGKGASEEILGEALGDGRKDAVIITKGGGGMNPDMRESSRRHLIAACEASLKRLKTDWIDLYFLHDPDNRTPLEETLRAMDDLIRQGKVRYIGCSKLPAWRMADAAWISKHLNLNRFIAAQEGYNLLSRSIEAEKLPAMAEYGMGLTPFFPLANGLLTGKYKSVTDIPAQSRFEKVPMFAKNFLNERNVAMALQLEAFAQERGHSLLELAFSWLAAQPSVATIIAGATSAEQVGKNATAANWALSAEDLAAIDAITL